MTQFPKSFLWGAAIAGHQAEGGNANSDTWFAENVTPSVFKEKSGQACNAFDMWSQDIDMVSDLGLTAYRFSIEWARVEPEEGRFDPEALDHYAAMLAACAARAIAPVVTFNHFTAPHWFAAKGGWLAPDAPAVFARYCAAIMAHMGGQIGHAVTLNEPNLPRLLTWVNMPQFVRDLERATLAACSAAAGVARYRLANVVLPEELDALEDGLAAAHLAARTAIKSARPDLPVGLSVAMVDDCVIGDDATLRDQKRAQTYDRWLTLAQGDDFVGVQNYERYYYTGAGQVSADGAPVQGGHFSHTDPQSLAETCRYAYAQSQRPVMVTEHGMNTGDDAKRCDFITQSLPHLHKAMGDGVPVLGYLHWSLLDNFEWIFGYGPKLGLVAVDRETFARSPKPSAQMLGKIARKGGL